MGWIVLLLGAFSENDRIAFEFKQDYFQEQNSSFINLKFVLGTPDLENSEPYLENLEPYLETEPIFQDEDLPNLIEGDSEELIGNLDYTDTTDELKG